MSQIETTESQEAIYPDGGNYGGNYGGYYGNDPGSGGGEGTGPGTYTQNADFTFQDSSYPYYQVQSSVSQYADAFEDAGAYGFQRIGNTNVGMAANDGGAIIVNNDTLVSKGTISVSDGTTAYSVGPSPGTSNAVFVKMDLNHFTITQGPYSGL